MGDRSFGTIIAQAGSMLLRRRSLATLVVVARDAHGTVDVEAVARREAPHPGGAMAEGGGRHPAARGKWAPTRSIKPFHARSQIAHRASGASSFFAFGPRSSCWRQAHLQL